MKLPDFLEELNQGAEKAFGENAKSMIDSRLYAKLPPKFIARLVNGTYEEIVAHLERELELNTLEEFDDLPIATMASSSGKTRNLLSNGIDINKNNLCSYCKAEDHFWKIAQNSKRKKKWKPTMARSPNAQLTQNVPPTCSKTNHRREKCWRGAGGHLRPKRERQDSKDTKPSEDEDTLTKNEKLQHLHQASQIQKNLIQKTNSATTPNM